MKLTDKRFGIFEFMMLLCGILTTCIEALNYGISLFDLMGHLLVFPLCFCMGGIATWKIIEPCCGKGAFLIGLYKRLYKYYLNKN